MTGTVAEGGGARGYGWILGEDGQKYFAHVSAIAGGAGLAVGDRVIFRPDQTPRGPRVLAVRPIERASGS